MMSKALGSILLLSALVGGSACSGSATCTGTLQDVGASCPTMFDGTEAQLPACQASYVHPQARTCGGLIDLNQTSGGGVDCFYDTATHELVGARAFGDLPICEGSFDKTAGRVFDQSCEQAPWTVMRDCNGST